MQETLINLTAVVIVGNLMALCAIPVAGIFWFVCGDSIRKALAETERD